MSVVYLLAQSPLGPTHGSNQSCRMAGTSPAHRSYITANLDAVMRALEQSAASVVIAWLMQPWQSFPSAEHLLAEPKAEVCAGKCIRHIEQNILRHPKCQPVITGEASS